MSHDNASAGAHGFHPHILPLKVYMAVGLSLFVLTGVTVAVAYVNLGGVGNLIVALLVATIKASLVAMFFMHLLYDNKLYLIVFLSSLLFLGIFIIITLFDVQRRGDIDPMRATVRDHPPIEGMVKAQERAAKEEQAASQSSAPANQASAETQTDTTTEASSETTDSSGQTATSPEQTDSEPTTGGEQEPATEATETGQQAPAP